MFGISKFIIYKNPTVKNQILETPHHLLKDVQISLIQIKKNKF